MGLCVGWHSSREEGSTSRREDDSPTGRVPHSLQNSVGSEDIGDEILLGMSDRFSDADMCCEMKHCIDVFFKYFLQDSCITDITVDEGEIFRPDMRSYIVSRSSWKIIENYHPEASSHAGIDEMWSDKAGSASYEKCLRHIFFLYLFYLYTSPRGHILRTWITSWFSNNSYNILYFQTRNLQIFSSRKYFVSNCLIFIAWCEYIKCLGNKYLVTTGESIKIFFCHLIINNAIHTDSLEIWFF